jgi:hypothetical protein
VLYEQQWSASHGDPADLGQGPQRVWYGAKHQGGHCGVKSIVTKGQRLGIGLAQLNGGPGFSQLHPGPPEEVRAGFDGCHLDVRRIVLEIGAGARSDLQNPSGKDTQEPTAGLAQPPPLNGGSHPVVKRSKGSVPQSHVSLAPIAMDAKAWVHLYPHYISRKRMGGQGVVI